MNSNESLIQKYNKAIPRYTSYPPVPFWQNKPTPEVWFSHIKKEYNAEAGVDLYIHVPFCEKLCYYCGCNRVITKNHSVEEEYVDLICKEWDLYTKELGFTPSINSLHLGGGTPNFLGAKNLDHLFSYILKNKNTDFIGSIEIDPRTFKYDQAQVLKKFNFKRVSLGIQDFDINVQTSINRVQSLDLVTNVVNVLRINHVESVNFDLIYGLPNQSVETIADTVSKVLSLLPDQISFYSYAHLPDRLKNQKLINENELPNSFEKRKIYLKGKELLECASYVEIGMDHFARNGSYLEIAKQNNKLKRNFMGYVDKKSNILIGLGPTSISSSTFSFVQNEKTYASYKENLEKNHLSFCAGHTQSDLDIEVEDIIQSLMCNRRVELTKIMSLPFYHSILDELESLKEDSIIKFTNEYMVVLDDAMGFVRNVANVFDVYQKNSEVAKGVKFSNSI